MSEASKTIAEFCHAKHLSKTSYYELKRRGLNPDELRIPNSKIVRITPEAEAAWDQRMTELSKSEAAELEVARRRGLTVIAGKRAAESPRHVSKKKASADTRPQRRRPRDQTSRRA